MGKTDRQLRHFVDELLDYAEKSKVFNPDFTTSQIPEIFDGWTELEFNTACHGGGEGCCICIGPGRYRINLAHCKLLRDRFIESRRSKRRLVLTFSAVLIAIIGILLGLLVQKRDKDQGHQEQNESGKNGIIHQEPPRK